MICRYFMPFIFKLSKLIEYEGIADDIYDFLQYLILILMSNIYFCKSRICSLMRAQVLKKKLKLLLPRQRLPIWQLRYVLSFRT